MNEALVLSVLIWTVMPVPGALQSRNASPQATVGGFERAMDVLRSETRGTAGGRQVLVPRDAGRIAQRPNTGAHPQYLEGRPQPSPQRLPGSDPVVVRRLVWFLRCLAATGTTLVIALVAGGGWLWLPFLISAVITAVYVAVLRHLKLQRDEARQVISELRLYDNHLPESQETVAGAEHGIGNGMVRLRRWND